MKMKIIAFAAAVCAAVSLSGCSDNENVAVTETTAAAIEARAADVTETSAEVQSEAVVGAQAALMSGEPAEEENEPFTSYTFTYSDLQDNYLVTLSPGEYRDIYNNGIQMLPVSAILTCEDKNFASQTIEATAPEGYYLALPLSADGAYTACNIIKNDCETGSIDITSVPQLIELNFWLYDYDDCAEEERPACVSKFYAVHEGKLSEVKMIDNTKQEGTVLPYCPVDMLHTEPLKLMETPVPEVTKDGVSLQIYTYTYDIAENTLTKNVEPPVQDNMLYFGYYYYYRAMEIAYYMYQTTPPVEDYENYIETEIASGDSTTTAMYFAISDPRFSTYEELDNYLMSIFSQRITEDMLAAAPMQYKDFDGKLYGILGDGGYNINLGPVTFTGYEISEDGQTITFHSRQLTRDDNGFETGYTDGGDFVLTANPDKNGYIITKFRYPYS